MQDVNKHGHVNCRVKQQSRFRVTVRQSWLQSCCKLDICQIVNCNIHTSITMARMPEMNWKHEPLADAFKAFKARMTLFLDDNEITDDAKKSTKIKLGLGDEGMRRVLASGLTEDQQKDPKEIWNLLESQVDASVKINFHVHRLELSNLRQRQGESITEYATRIRDKAIKCSFNKDELNKRLIEMIILSTPFEEFRKELLTKPKGFEIKTVLERGIPNQSYGCDYG